MVLVRPLFVDMSATYCLLIQDATTRQFVRDSMRGRIVLAQG